MTRFLPLLVAALAVAAAGVVHGLRTDRWGAKADVQAAAARLDGVPTQVGDWDGRPFDMDARQLAVAEAVGHLSRTYVNRRTGAEVTVVVLCGRPGPVALHSPEVCYTGAGYALSGDAGTCSVQPEGGGRPAEVFKGQFVKPGTPPDMLNVFWAWKADGPWGAPSNPRLTFVRSTVLYKLYAIRRLARLEDGSSQDPCLDFLQEFLPELDKRISPSA